MFKEDQPTKKKTEDSVENQSHTCPNPICGKVFTKPIKVENVSSGKPTLYEACPYCLTEITVEKEAPTIPKQRLVSAEKTDAVELEPELKKEKINVVQQPSAEAAGCKHYFGYLSERSSRDKLPEECIVCPNIVQCMLKSVTG